MRATLFVPDKFIATIGGNFANDKRGKVAWG